MTEQYSAEIQEQTPSLIVPITIHAPPVPLTAEERKVMYAEIRKFDDFMMLPVPEDFWDDDVVSERGLTQLHMDAHRVSLLNQGLMELSAEKEATLRTRLTRKIGMLRAMRGLPALPPPTDLHRTPLLADKTDPVTPLVLDGVVADGSGEPSE
jgi:hypothetical protein